MPPEVEPRPAAPAEAASPDVAPVTAPGRPGHGDRFEIEPVAPDGVIGRAHYRIPGALRQHRIDGRFVCQWTFELDPAAPQDRRPRPASPLPEAFVHWAVEGTHKVLCDVRWQRDVNGPRTPQPPPPIDARRLERSVTVRSLETLSAQRFDATATPDAYFDARLRDRMPVQGESRAQRARREDRVQAQDEASDTIAPGRQVIARAMLTPRGGGPSQPLAIAIGPAADAPDQLVLVDFTPGMRRIEYGRATSTAQAIENLKNRNSYPAGLVEIDVPANEHGVAAHHARFETTGESDIAAWGRNVRTAGLAATLAGAGAMLAGTTVAVPLLVIGGAIGAVASGISLAERMHDAVPDQRGIALDVLAIASALLGTGGAIAGGATVTYGGRTMAIVSLTGRAGLVVDGTSFVLASTEGVENIVRIWNQPGLSETQKVERIAQVVGTLAVSGGLLAVSARQQLGAQPQQPGARPTTEPAAAAAPAERTPQQIVAEMQAERARATAGLAPRDPAWRQHVTPETAMVRVISERELSSLVGRGRVVNTGLAERLRGDPHAAHTWATNHLFDGEPGQLRLRQDFGTTNAGSAAPVMPVSAFGPANGYAESLIARSDRYLVRFRDGVTRMPGNPSIAETEYLLPAGYRLDQIEWIADVRNNRWLYGAPGRAGTAEELAALRGAVPAPQMPPRPTIPPDLVHEQRLQIEHRRVLQLARQRRNREVEQEVMQMGRTMRERFDGFANDRRGSTGQVDAEYWQQEVDRIERTLRELRGRLE